MTEIPRLDDDFSAGIPAEDMVRVLNSRDDENESLPGSEVIEILHDDEPRGTKYVGKNVLLDLRHLHFGSDKPDSRRVPSDAVVIGYSAQDDMYTVTGIIPAIDEFPASPFTMKLSRKEVRAAFLEKNREREVYLETRRRLGSDATSLSADQPPAQV